MSSAMELPRNFDGVAAVLTEGIPGQIYGAQIITDPDGRVLTLVLTLISEQPCLFAGGALRGLIRIGHEGIRLVIEVPDIIVMEITPTDPGLQLAIRDEGAIPDTTATRTIEIEKSKNYPELDILDITITESE